jgi:hypothetical protein
MGMTTTPGDYARVNNLSAGFRGDKTIIREIPGISASQMRPIDPRKNLQGYNHYN